MPASETWDYSYVTLMRNDERFTLKVLHYQSHNEYKKEWYRIYPQGFDINKMASEQPFGFGQTLEQAFKRYFATLELNARSS